MFYPVTNEVSCTNSTSRTTLATRPVIYVVGDTLYALETSTSRLKIYDISNSMSPSLLSNTLLTGHTDTGHGDMVINSAETVAFITCDNASAGCAVQSWDISDKTAPSYLDREPFSGSGPTNYSRTPQIVGTNLICFCQPYDTSSTIQKFDISDPSAISYTSKWGSAAVVFNRAGITDGTYCYVSGYDYTGGDYNYFGVFNPTTMSMVGTYTKAISVTSEQWCGMALSKSGNYVYLWSSYANKVYTINVTTKSNPSLTHTLDLTSYADPGTDAFEGNLVINWQREKMFVPASNNLGYGGLLSVNIATETAPAYSSTIDAGEGACYVGVKDDGCETVYWSIWAGSNIGVSYNRNPS